MKPPARSPAHMLSRKPGKGSEARAQDEAPLLERSLFRKWCVKHLPEIGRNPFTRTRTDCARRRKQRRNAGRALSIVDCCSKDFTGACVRIPANRIDCNQLVAEAFRRLMIVFASVRARRSGPDKAKYGLSAFQVTTEPEQIVCDPAWQSPRIAPDRLARCSKGYRNDRLRPVDNHIG